jgi:CspA family cold shock protein
VNNRDRNFRPDRHRSFDDDSAPPRRNFGFASPSGPQFETPSGPSVRATVKWYNPDKGFGFVTLEDGTGDAFLHVSVVERSSNSTVPPRLHPGGAYQPRSERAAGDGSHQCRQQRRTA